MIVTCQEGSVFRINGLELSRQSRACLCPLAGRLKDQL